MKKLLGTLLVISLLTSCTTPREIIREVPVEVVKTEYKTQYVHDSIYVHDSSFVEVKGDTVYSTIFKTKYVKNTVHDTLVTHDTVPQPITVTETKVVEKKVPQWWPVYLTGGLILLIGIAYVVVKSKLLQKLHI